MYTAYMQQGCQMSFFRSDLFSYFFLSSLKKSLNLTVNMYDSFLFLIYNAF